MVERGVTRRRGEALEHAILEAAIAELVEVGYTGLTVEAVAARAGAGKVSIYRRWPTKPALVVAAAYHASTPLQEPPDTGSLRTDTFGWLRSFADHASGPIGAALLGVIVEAGRSGQVGELGRHSLGRGRQVAALLVERARLRGEPVGAHLTDLQLATPSSVLQHHIIVHGYPIAAEVVWSIVDEVALPLWTGSSVDDR